VRSTIGANMERIRSRVRYSRSAFANLLKKTPTPLATTRLKRTLAMRGSKNVRMAASRTMISRARPAYATDHAHRDVHGRVLGRVERVVTMFLNV
jgi:hypothetical protein